MRSGIQAGQALPQDLSIHAWADRCSTTVSPLANCIGPDALLAKHMLSLADRAQAAQNTELAARFIELAMELLDEAHR
jgi:hypothetical protein